MADKVILLVTGGLIGVLSSLITTFVNAHLQTRRQEKEWERQTRTRNEDLQRKELESIRNLVASDQLQRISGESRITRLKPTRWFCSAVDTQITMADKSKKPVQALSAGIAILTYDNRSRSFGRCEVKKVECVTVPRFIIINGKLSVSESHQVFTTDGWVRAIDLRMGEFIIRDDNSAEEVRKVELINSSIEVYAVTLMKSGAFFAEGLCVSDYVSKQADIDERLARDLDREEEVFIDSSGEIIEAKKDRST